MTSICKASVLITNRERVERKRRKRRRRREKLENREGEGEKGPKLISKEILDENSLV